MTTDQQNKTSIETELFDKLPGDKFATPQMGSENESSVDLSVAMQKALAQPEFYPPLNESIFPGDRVGIVLQPDLPHPRKILKVLLEQLCSVDVVVSDIVIVIAPVMASQFGIESKLFESNEDHDQDGVRPPILPVEFEFNTINFQVHDFENKSGLSYLAANEAGEPVYVNRNLVDADVVLPVGSPTPGEADKQPDCIYPNFGANDAKDRFGDGKGSFITRWKEIELANDSLGAFFAIQVVFGQGEAVQKVIAGARKDAVAQARKATNVLWSFNWDSAADVTVATIETTSQEQDWQDFASALVTASRASQSDGPLVIWSELKSPPDRNTRKAIMSQFEDAISTKLTKTLQHVAAIVHERPVYLKSELKRNAVEELGLGFIETADEVIRIAEPHQTGLVIRDAHKCQFAFDSDQPKNNDETSNE